MAQISLFAGAAPPIDGFRYQSDFLLPEEERELLARIGELPLEEARYKEFTAKRRIASFGHQYDFSSNELLPAGPLPEFLVPLRARVAEWTGIAAADYTHCLVAEYRPGTQLGWHRDVPEFEAVAGCSLAGSCRMRLRRYPHAKGSRERALIVELAPRSVYALEGPARWGWQHAISPTKELRYSITFRTRARGRATS
jgi:alkylated DNA repair dioxygenase AlkB